MNFFSKVISIYFKLRQLKDTSFYENDAKEFLGIKSSTHSFVVTKFVTIIHY